MSEKITRYRVTAAMIVVRIPGAQGGEAYLKRGRLLPPSTESKECKRLLELGLIEKVTVAAPDTSKEPDATGIPEGEPSTDWKVDQLRALAAQRGVSLGDATTKAAILDALATAGDEQK